MSQGLHGVRQAARERKQDRFTALLHHLNVGKITAPQELLRGTETVLLDGKRHTKTSVAYIR
jgi:hypothetical protein